MALLLSSSAVAAAVLPQQAVRGDLNGRVRVAQACGWYAIASCGRSLRAAQQFSRRMGVGYVLDTSSHSFPNFRPGFFCVVSGPMSRSRALGMAREWRYEGLAPDAYAKNAC